MDHSGLTNGPVDNVHPYKVLCAFVHHQSDWARTLKFGNNVEMRFHMARRSQQDGQLTEVIEAKEALWTVVLAGVLATKAVNEDDTSYSPAKFPKLARIRLLCRFQCCRRGTPEKSDAGASRLSFQLLFRSRLLHESFNLFAPTHIPLTPPSIVHIY